MKKSIGIPLAMGVLLGTLVGVLTDNIGLWLSVGIAIGAGVGTTLMAAKSKKDKEEES